MLGSPRARCSSGKSRICSPEHQATRVQRLRKWRVWANMCAVQDGSRELVCAQDDLRSPGVFQPAPTCGHMKEDDTVVAKTKAGGIIRNERLAKIGVMSAPDRPGLARDVMNALGDEDINVELLCSALT